MDGHVARVGEMRNSYEIFVGKSERKVSLRKLRPVWEDKIKMDLCRKNMKEWIEVKWLRIGSSYNFCEHGNEHWRYIESGTSLSC
jgi:hypothetical protein